ncbi:MAG: hypothetical protein HZC05_03045 [Candidatus Magasanikbacteria bacterium]|nr:hypothetical protein [Candidatus Magasanikbacteria bacterium]
MRRASFTGTKFGGGKRGRAKPDEDLFGKQATVRVCEAHNKWNLYPIFSCDALRHYEASF